MHKQWVLPVLLIPAGLLPIWLAVSGMISGEALYLRRFGPDTLVDYAQHPAAFQILVLIYLALGILIWAIAAFCVWGAFKGKRSEERYFRQKELLEPRKD